MGKRQYLVGTLLLIFNAALFTGYYLWGIKELYRQTPVTQEGIQRALKYGNITSPTELRATTSSAWSLNDLFGKQSQNKIAQGRHLYFANGCWYCHTQMPEQGPDWEYFGAPPKAGDELVVFPTSHGSGRTGPDLLHIGSRMPSKEWHIMHLKNPRDVVPKSIMPRFDYLSDAELDALAEFLVNEL